MLQRKGQLASPSLAAQLIRVEPPRCALAGGEGDDDGLHGTQATAVSHVLLLLDDDGWRGRAGHRFVDLREAGFFLHRQGAVTRSLMADGAVAGMGGAYDVVSSTAATMLVPPCSPTCRPRATRRSSASWLGARVAERGADLELRPPRAGLRGQ